MERIDVVDVVGRSSTIDNVNSQPGGVLAGHLTGYKTRPYRLYVLSVLLLVYTLSCADKTLTSVFAQPIISTFHLTDSQWGLLSGPPFAMFYAVMGLPFAAWADRSKRVGILAFCIVVWSVMAASCGLAGGFLMLFIFRMGVAVGEAGCGPVSNSLIGDYFKPAERPKVLSIWALGIPVGIVTANLLGGAIAGLHGAAASNGGSGTGFAHLLLGILGVHVEGWRLAFVLVAAPGLLIAPLVYFSVKEPPRGYSDPPTVTPQAAPGFVPSLKELLHKPAYLWVLLAGFQIALATYGVTAFQAPLLQRMHGLSAQHAAIQFGVPIGIATAFGSLLCGWMIEKLTPRYFSAVAWLPAIGAVAAAPFYLIAFHSTDLDQARIFWVFGAFFSHSSIGSQFAIGQGVVSGRSRAVAIAVVLFVTSGLGGSVGPYLLGGISDSFASFYLHSSSVAAGLSPHLCKIQSNLTSAQLDACHFASSHGLRDSISLIVCIFISAGVCFAMCGMRLKKDYVVGLK
ncbi:spinster family MFS transporter [Paraburkholderia megapolitana]|uniref:spinster family MFS transporter n=1 Tax=Paraburkholderia megapolitana TaxID=420953 RepID=UPI0038BBE95C